MLTGSLILPGSIVVVVDECRRLTRCPYNRPTTAKRSNGAWGLAWGLDQVAAVVERRNGGCGLARSLNRVGALGRQGHLVIQLLLKSSRSGGIGQCRDPDQASDAERGTSHLYRPVKTSTLKS